MKNLAIHPRILRMFVFMFLLNIVASVSQNYHKEIENSFFWFVNLFFPVFVTIIGGSVIGMILFMFPQPVKDTTSKLIRSKVMGMMVLTAVFFVLYLYNFMAGAMLK
ncbi:MAG: hypothetical protein EP332_00640 [Bacteroidetes bacterium]|nr:MAG: hypothetical protein EP332_00640 [Bacteroidota bacterium]